MHNESFITNLSRIKNQFGIDINDSSDNSSVEIMREPPYYHAIPIMLHNDLEIDCLAAIDKGKT